MVQQRRIHRRHALEDRHAAALDELEHLTGEEARDQREAGARGDREVEPARLPERVEQRQRTEDDVVAAHRQQIAHHLDVGHQVAVRQLGALRPARGAGRVEDHGGVIVIALGYAGVGLGVTGQRGRVVEDQHRARVGDVVTDLARLEQRVHGTTTPPMRRTP